MVLDLLLLTVGIALLIGGGEFLVRGASSIASGLGVPPVVIGLTVVAFGTSAPELAVNIQAAITGNGDLSFGNIMGSNLANIGLIVGCAAVIRPLAIHAVVVKREIPMMLFATIAVLVMTLDPSLRGSEAASLDRIDGILLLVLFGVFLSYTARDVFKARSTREMVGEVREEVSDSRTGIPVAVGMTIAGLGGLVLGGRVTVGAAEAIVRLPGGRLGSESRREVDRFPVLTGEADASCAERERRLDGIERDGR